MKNFKFISFTAIILLVFLYVFIYSEKSRDFVNLKYHNKEYVDIWNKVDSLSRKGLTRSVIRVVETIYEKAKKEDNAPQFIKSVIYKIKFESNIEEEALVQAIQKVSREIETARYPVKPILHSYLASIYWNYYENNRWNFKERSAATNISEDDIRTWDLKRIIEKTIHHYLLSLDDKPKLKKTQINIYDDILVVKDKTLRKLRPTLFDFLAHRAVNYFMNEESDLIKPSYSFKLESPKYFSPYNTFCQLKISSSDTFSLKLHALKILQEIIVFHRDDPDPSALIDADLKRLKFVKARSVIEKKDSVYLDALLTLRDKFKKSNASAEIDYEIASVYFRKGLTYKPLQSDTNKWMLKKAHTICSNVIANVKKPADYGVECCKYLLSRIEEKKISFLLENFNIPKKSSKTLITYKNVSKAYIRIVKCDPFWFQDIQQRKRGNQIEQIRKKKGIKEWTQDLRSDGDFQSHSAEIEIPPLSEGFYYILVSSHPKFHFKKHVVAYSGFWISNISYIKRNDYNSAAEIYVLNRTTGKPMKDVSVRIFFKKYNRNKKKYEYHKGKIFTTDKNGYLLLPQSENREYIILELSHNKDMIHTQQIYISGESTGLSKIKLKTHFFTDRAIYRPGQIIFFKGIVLEKDREKTSIKPNFYTTVTFYDVNRQEIDDVTLATNEYGTFHGTFTAPKGVLNGTMYIQDKHGYQPIRIEEYKRPKFEVTINPVKDQFRLYDSISVTGKARSYSGTTVDNASIRYRVLRHTVLPYWSRWYFPRFPLIQKKMEIINGVLKTDEKGEFSIGFHAVPDEIVSKETEPKFHFTLYVDVTDINGETNSTRHTIPIGYTALNLSVGIPEKLNKESKEKFYIKTANQSGQYEYARGTITIHRLKQPKRLFRKRIWKKPDVHLLSKDEYYEKFPYDSYSDEDDIKNWEKDTEVFDLNFNTEKDSSFELKKIKKWKPGQYILEAFSKDRYGEKVKDIKYITVYSIKDNTVPVNSFDWFTTLKDRAEPGETVTILLGSRCKDQYVLYEIENKEKITGKNWIRLHGNQKKIDIPVKEEYRGNFFIHCTFVRENRKYRHDVQINVPYTNKQLDLEFATFRNKITPGDKEEWKIRIKSDTGEKIAAELLASMYDASLDAFVSHSWRFPVYIMFRSVLSWNDMYSFSVKNLMIHSVNWNIKNTRPVRNYDRLNFFGFISNERPGIDDILLLPGGIRGGGGIGYGAGYGSGRHRSSLEVKSIAAENPADTYSESVSPEGDVYDISQESFSIDNLKEGNQKPDFVKTRKNFNETAFFFPNLKTNKEGDVIISFTMPEALTRWKFMGLAHTTDLKTGQIQKETVTQKNLMVIPNAPRFLREQDQISFSTKIVNISENNLSGKAKLHFYDAISMKPVNILLDQKRQEQPFDVKKDQSISLFWKLNIPEGIQAIACKVTAKAGNFSDGEEFVLPVLSNRMLVTETLPLPVRGKQTRKYNLKKLSDSYESNTIKNHKLTLEYTSNPAWYAVQALPYLMEYAYDCTEQIFCRYYTNSIASHIVNSNPLIKRVFDNWRELTPDALLSNLEKNQELKNILLQETPWVLQAKNESKRKRNIALLFDLNKMANEQRTALQKLKNLQSSEGGWPWFKGMPKNRYISQHIITGFGHLRHLGINDFKNDRAVRNMIVSGVRYLDKELQEEYDRLRNRNNISMDSIVPGSIVVHYFYARSYFLDDIALSKKYRKAFNYFKTQLKNHWLEYNSYLKGMIALALHRLDVPSLPLDIMKSLKENAIYSEELGMCWNDINPGYYWYQAPIETIALLIEAFSEVLGDEKSVEAMKIWLLENRQTNDWKTTKATSEACYALLLKGSDWLAKKPRVKISLGKLTVEPSKLPDVRVEAGSGYFKTSWLADQIKPDMGSIVVKKEDDGIAWGALYWQYFERLDKITFHKTPLSLNKKLYREKNSSSGPVIEPVTEKMKLSIGDKITVRIELRVDRNMEYIHMKDMRAAGFEPLNVISRYKYQDGLWYYESAKDASTNFFITFLPKGTYVFEYPLRVSQAGFFSNGITTVQCMYAPEFTSHSEGIRVNVSN